MGRRRMVAGIAALAVLAVLVAVPPALMVASSADRLALAATGEGLVNPAAADPTVPCYPDADADVCDGAPTQKTGTSPYMYAGHDIDTGRYQAYVHFDLSDIPEEATIIAASFNAYVDMVSGYPQVVVHEVLEAWSESDVTWETRPMIGQQVFSTDLTYDDAGTWIHWDMTGIVTEWLAGSANHGLCLVGWGQPANGDLTVGDYARFRTRETANDAPYLSVTYTSPEEPVTPTPDETPPTVTVTHSPEQVSASDEVTFLATVAADPSGIDRIEIHVVDQGEQMCPCPSSPCSCDGGPYAEGTVVTYYAVAWDGAGNEGRTDDHQFTVGAPADRNPPLVEIVHNPPSPTILDEVRFQAMATDASGIVLLEIYVNDAKVKECTGSVDTEYIECEHTEEPFGAETVTYAARAQDGAGNIATAYGSVTVSAKLCDIGILPEEWDWRDWGLVGPVWRQGHCGSCWAFSTIGAVEGAYCAEHSALGTSINLSEQNLVSGCCDAGSCNGGWPHLALRHVKRVGVVDEACSPYQSQDCKYEVPSAADPNVPEWFCCDPAAAPVHNCTPCTCDDGSCSNPCLCGNCPDWNDRLWRIDSYRAVALGMLLRPDIEDIKRALVCHGPLSVTSRNWGHAVVLVGYDDDSAVCRTRYGEDGCWILKNSWGVFTGWWSSDGVRVWHENGYAFIPYKNHQYSDVMGCVFYAEGVTPP